METPLRCLNRDLNSKGFTPDSENTKHFIAPETPFLEKIGYGTGVGVYHLNRTSLTGKSPKSPWAIKKVLRQKKDDFRLGRLLVNEASVLRQLNHPNIVGFRGFTKTDDGREVLAMEECSISLGDMNEQRFEQQLQMYSKDEILTVCLSIAKAFYYLHHEVMVMHCDVKSYNILINGDFEAVKLCDFGSSVKVNKDGKALGKCIGTPIWSAPEVLNDEEVTVKADIFSLGLVIYEMIALHPPHIDEDECSYNEPEDDNDNADDSIYEEIYGKRPKLPDVLIGNEYNLVLEIYFSCTEQDPNERPLSNDLITKIERQKV